MKRTLRVKRLYTLGQFKNIAFEDEITDIPQNVWMNPEAIKLLRKLQLIQVDGAYAQYVRESGVVNKKLNTAQELEEYVELLDEQHLTTLENITEATASKEDTLEKRPETVQEQEVLN